MKYLYYNFLSLSLPPFFSRHFILGGRSLSRSNGIHNVRLSDTMWGFINTLIDSGRFQNATDVTHYAYQEIMRREGYSPKDKEHHEDDTLSRIIVHVNHLYSNYREIKITRTPFTNQVKQKKDWLSLRYPKVNKLTIQEFIDMCIDESLPSYIRRED